MEVSHNKYGIFEYQQTRLENFVIELANEFSVTQSDLTLQINPEPKNGDDVLRGLWLVREGGAIGMRHMKDISLFYGRRPSFYCRRGESKKELEKRLTTENIRCLFGQNGGLTELAYVTKGLKRVDISHAPHSTIVTVHHEDILDILYSSFAKNNRDHPEIQNPYLIINFTYTANKKLSEFRNHDGDLNNALIFVKSYLINY